MVFYRFQGQLSASTDLYRWADVCLLRLRHPLAKFSAVSLGEQLTTRLLEGKDQKSNAKMEFSETFYVNTKITVCIAFLHY